MNYQFPIGNIESGIDINMVEDLLEAYHTQILRACTNCAITRLCPVCYAIVGGPNGFERNPEDICESALYGVKRRFEELWTLFEGGVAESAILKAKNNPCSDI
jgi:uncharacterized protein